MLQLSPTVPPMPLTSVANNRSAIRTYFENHLPGHTVKELPPHGVRPLGFLIEKSDNQYTIEFEHEILKNHDPDQMLQLLDDWQVVEELCRGEGLRYVLTERGLRLDSSN